MIEIWSKEFKMCSFICAATLATYLKTMLYYFVDVCIKQYVR